MNDLLLPGAGRQRRSRSLGKIYRSCTYLHSDLVRLDSNQREYQKFVRTGSVVFTNLTHCLTLKPFDMSQPRRSLLLVSVESERANQIVSRSTGRICFCFLLSSHTNQDSSRARSAILQRMHEMLPHSFDRSTRLRCFNMAFDLRAECLNVQSHSPLKIHFLLGRSLLAICPSPPFAWRRASRFAWCHAPCRYHTSRVLSRLRSGSDRFRSLELSLRGPHD
jgi:hypothetical protein